VTFSQEEHNMKTALLFAGVLALLLSACDEKKSPVPAAPPAPKVESATPPPGAMTAEDKMKAMDSAKSAAKSAGGGKE
jgi:hypothetical protein